MARGGVPNALVIPAVGAIGGSLRSVLPCEFLSTGVMKLDGDLRTFVVNRLDEVGQTGTEAVVVDAHRVAD
ncbi:MAG TPA: hypothetical protein VF328_14550, partial [Mycobacterium sp.]